MIRSDISTIKEMQMIERWCVASKVTLVQLAAICNGHDSIAFKKAIARVAFWSSLEAWF